MISFQFETYIADGAEHYSYGADYGKGMVQTSKTVSFPESLLSLVDMNIDEIEPAIRQLNEVLWQLTTTREKQYVEEVNALLDELELRHIYFQQLALDWRYRLSRAVIFEQYTEDMLPRKYLYAALQKLRQVPCGDAAWRDGVLRSRGRRARAHLSGGRGHQYMDAQQAGR